MKGIAVRTERRKPPSWWLEVGLQQEKPPPTELEKIRKAYLQALARRRAKRAD